jgi:TET-Associated Glycosyltransferase
MQIIIPTRGRRSNQLTIASLIGCDLIKKTTIVCPKNEYNHFRSLRNDYDVVAQPDPSWTIAQKRKWILEEWCDRCYDKIIMLDDDLRFATRISEDDWHLKEIQGEELALEFKRLEEKLGSEFPHVGFGPRQGNNRLEEVGWKTPAKMCYSLGYYLPVVLQECELGRIETREDMDLTLQLLRKGYPNAVWMTTVNDQRKYDAPGGATDERTIESSNADARRLAELHPGYVSITGRKYKASVPRIEVICQWQKALEDGLRAKATSKQAS